MDTFEDTLFFFEHKIALFLFLIQCSIHPTDNSIIVTFEKDKNKMPFEVHFRELNPYSFGMRKWDYYEINIKFESEIFEDEKAGKKSYFTHLFGSNPKSLHSMFTNEK